MNASTRREPRPASIADQPSLLSQGVVTGYGAALARIVGIKDVARQAGVSIGTVSNVINRPDQVSERTRVRVQAAIDLLGFVRSESARQLRAGRSRRRAG